MVQKQVPVLLLTGYLGSGKTTLLNRILQNTKGLKFAVIVNDIGEINIDADLIQKGGVVQQKDESLVALQNGCICCTLKMDLVEQLHDIIASAQFDYIAIEASGICEPAPIAQTICSIPSLAPQYAKDGVPVLHNIVTIVDALRMRDEFASGENLTKENLEDDDLENLVIQQIEFCSTIILNKKSEVAADELDHIKKIIRAIQPKADILECDYGDVDIEQIVNQRKFFFDEVAGSAAWIQAMEEEDDDEEGEALEYGIGTFVYTARRPFNLNRFDDFVARRWPKTVIRAKGMCYFHDEYDTCYVFEQAGRQFQLKNAGLWYATMSPEELQDLLNREPQLVRDWDDEYGDRMQKLVFIGQNMDRNAICKELDECLV